MELGLEVRLVQIERVRVKLVQIERVKLSWVSNGEVGVRVGMEWSEW
jgi:hypothetical protein